jgi:hypothetical protein
MPTTNPTYVNPFTGQSVSPTVTSYESLTISVNTTLQWSINGNNQNQVTANIIEVTATVASLNLIMPPATQVSSGQTLLIRNIGSNSFTVTNNSGGTIITIASGVAQFIYVTDNTTSAGTWATVTFGAGTSSANASALAGNGLTALNTTLNQSYNVTTYSSSQTLNASNRANFNVWTGGVGTLTLPSASSVGNNWFMMVRNNGTGIVTISPVGSDTINGNANQQLQLTESLVIVSNGASGWYTFGYGRSNSFAFTQFAISVTGGTLTLSSAQASNIIQQYTGTLTSNQIVIVPSTVQLYTFSNNTTGAYTFTVKTSAIGGATLTIASGQTSLIICDGTNVYNAQTTTSSVASSLTFGNGSSSTPSANFIGDTSTGIYLVGSGILGFAVSGTIGATLSSTGLYVPNGVGGGIF